ncbi:MAG: aminopeptidase N, partial [Phyllobacteriaceae bacterium]|nr:aminopeptidase N [Phyllobacteriaceae bacterium]
MQTETPQTIYLKDYQPAPQAIRHVKLLVDLHPTATCIVSEMQVEPRASAPMVLHGEGLELVSVAIDGVELVADRYSYANDLLTIAEVPSRPFTLRIEQRCNPQANTA